MGARGRVEGTIAVSGRPLDAVEVSLLSGVYGSRLYVVLRELLREGVIVDSWTDEVPPRRLYEFSNTVVV